MDLRVYFQKIKQVEAVIEAAYAVIVSHETSDGGKAGVLTEAPKSIAAALVVEGKARLATVEEAGAFQDEKRLAKEEADRSALAGRVQLSVVSDSELKAIKTVLKGAKKD